MTTQSKRTGAKKPGRPAIPARAGRAAREYRNMGFPDELIIGAIAPHLLPPASMSTRERKRRIRQTLDRWERKAGIAASPVNREREKALATLGYASKRVGEGWAGWDGGDGTPAALEVTAQGISAQIAEIEAAKSAEVFGVPMTRESDGGCSLLQARVDEITERIEQVQRAERRERVRSVHARARGKTTADYAAMSVAEREQWERDLGLEATDLRADAMSRLPRTIHDLPVSVEHCPMCGDEPREPPCELCA